ncbi:unnamed protein product [Oikopleura dioica]|uniref:Uncharacterized protein n=1 Tax=Oikopleura dioica TaxID=34765 RepID=E4Z2Y5_OIKDI|nr:unnamed protein product [Oikopleura dioica]
MKKPLVDSSYPVNKAVRSFLWSSKTGAFLLSRYFKGDSSCPEPHCAAVYYAHTGKNGPSCWIWARDKVPSLWCF